MSLNLTDCFTYMNAEYSESPASSLVAQGRHLGDQEKCLWEMAAQIQQLSAGFSQFTKQPSASTTLGSTDTTLLVKSNKFNGDPSHWFPAPVLMLSFLGVKLSLGPEQ